MNGYTTSISAIPLQVELPAGSARPAPLARVADELATRLVRIFLRDEGRGGRRPVLVDDGLFQADPSWRDHVPFHEDFHGEHGAGLGASHQTGWTAPVAERIRRADRYPQPGQEGRQGHAG